MATTAGPRHRDICLYVCMYARIYISETFKLNHIYNKEPLFNLTPNKVVITNNDGKLATSNNIDLVKLGYLDDVSSPIGASLLSLQSTRQPSIAGAATTITDTNLTPNKVLRMYVCMYVCVYVCMYVLTVIHNGVACR